MQGLPEHEATSIYSMPWPSLTTDSERISGLFVRITHDAPRIHRLVMRKGRCRVELAFDILHPVFGKGICGFLI